MTNLLIFKKPGCFPEFVKCFPHLSFSQNKKTYKSILQWRNALLQLLISDIHRLFSCFPTQWYWCPWSDILRRKVSFKHSGKLYKDSVFFQCSVEGITFSDTERSGHDATKKWRSAIACKVACVRVLQLKSESFFTEVPNSTEVQLEVSLLKTAIKLGKQYLGVLIQKTTTADIQGVGSNGIASNRSKHASMPGDEAAGLNMAGHKYGKGLGTYAKPCWASIWWS